MLILTVRTPITECTNTSLLQRQQQNRFMKALATQRLMEQVSSLEKNVNKMNLSAGRAGEANQKPTVYTVVVDVTAFLDGLHKVKKWANKALNSNSRSQSSIIEVVVPLEGKLFRS